MSLPRLPLSKRWERHWLKPAPSEMLQALNTAAIEYVLSLSSFRGSRRRLRQRPTVRREHYSDLGLDELRIECLAFTGGARAAIRYREQPDEEKRERHREQRRILIREKRRLEIENGDQHGHAEHNQEDADAEPDEGN